MIQDIRQIQSFQRYAGDTAQKMKLSTKDCFSKCDQIRRKLKTWSHSLKKSLVENFSFVQSDLKNLKRNHKYHFIFTSVLASQTGRFITSEINLTNITFFTKQNCNTLEYKIINGKKSMIKEI